MKPVCRTAVLISLQTHGEGTALLNLLIQAQSDFSLQETLQAHGWRRLKPFDSVDEQLSLTRIHRFSDGTVSKLELRDQDGAIEVTSDTAVDETELVAAVRIMLQLDLPVEEFHRYCDSHPLLGHVSQKRQGRVLRSPTVWEDVVKVILTTNTTWAQTRTMTARLVDTWGSPLNSPSPDGPRSFPTPAQIAEVPFEEFAEKARLGYRSAAIHSLATDIVAKSREIESWMDACIPDADLWKSLNSLKGVGPYAASCLMIYLGRYGRVNVDSWARMMVGRELDRPVTDKDVHEFFAPYGKWQALVYHFYPWRTEEPAY